MIKKLLNIYDEDLYLRIQIWCKKNKTDANAFINTAMEEKMTAIENGEKPAKAVEDEAVPVDQITGQATVAEEKSQEIEQVMNNGIQFLAGLFKMSTGKDLGLSGKSLEINKETGEIVMNFKLPV